jgi:two-component system, sensor histidine kinase LadS
MTCFFLANKFVGLPEFHVKTLLHWLCWTVFLWLSSSLMAIAAATPQAVLSEKGVTIDLAKLGEYWIDTSGTLKPEEVAANSTATWRVGPASGIYPLLPGQALWLRFNVLHLSDSSHWLLEVPYAALNRASLFTTDARGGYQAQHAGDLIANSAWALPQRHIVMEIETSLGIPTEYLLRLENAQGFSAPIRLISTDKLLRSEQGMSLILGAYFGIAFLGVIVGLAGLVWLRDWAYFFYAACALLIGLTQAASTGIGSLYLWPNSPLWADRSLAISGILAVASFALLNAKIISLAQRSRRIDAFVWALAIVGLGLCAALFTTDSGLRLALSTPYVLLMVLVVVAINLWAWRHGDRFGIWLLVSALPFMLAIALVLARVAQWIPLTLYTEQSWLGGMALQQIVMLAALFNRSQQRRENRRRIAGVDRIDPATGLINEHVFSTRLLRMLARSEKLKNQSAVVLVEITNTKQIQRDFGRKSADELPLRVASRLLSTAREIDSAGRLSEHQFGMLVEGPVSAEEAATLGPRIIARCLMPYSKLHMDCVAQVRVAYALVPEQWPDPQPLMERLEALLAKVPVNGKTAVFRLGEAPPKPRRRAQRRPENF